jgi:hypothetical protein
MLNRYPYGTYGYIMEMTVSSNKSWKINMLEKLQVSFHKINNKELQEETGGEFAVIC